MNRPTLQIGFDKQGRVVSSDRGAEPAKYHRGYSIVAMPPGFILLKEVPRSDRITRPTNLADARLLLAGEILSHSTIIEVINMIMTSNWRGELTLLGDESAPSFRSLVFDQGALKYARSDQPEDRLGEVLFNAGVVTRAQLDVLLAEATPERRIGQIVVEQGFLSQEELFEYLKRQIVQVFFAALTLRAGFFYFTAYDPSQLLAPSAFHFPVQMLLMEGVQRMDEIALFRQRVPRDSFCPEAVPEAFNKTHDSLSEKVLKHSDGRHSLRDLSKALGIEPFQTLKVVYNLVQQGDVVLRSGADPDDHLAMALIDQFNNVLRDIYLALHAHGAVERAQATLGSWLQGSGYDALFGKQLNPDGSVTASKVIAALKSRETPHPLETLHQALHELAAFAMFAATTSLPREQEMQLAREFNRRIQAIRVR